MKKLGVCPVAPVRRSRLDVAPPRAGSRSVPGLTVVGLGPAGTRTTCSPPRDAPRVCSRALRADPPASCGRRARSRGPDVHVVRRPLRRRPRPRVGVRGDGGAARRRRRPGWWRRRRTVPGSPAVAERTVRAPASGAVDLDVVPGLSFAELAWARLGVDPLGGARVVDGREFTVDAPCASTPALELSGPDAHRSATTRSCSPTSSSSCSSGSIPTRRSRCSSDWACPTNAPSTTVALDQHSITPTYNPTSPHCRGGTPARRPPPRDHPAAPARQAPAAIRTGVRGTPSRPTTRSPATSSRSRTRW